MNIGNLNESRDLMLKKCNHKFSSDICHQKPVPSRPSLIEARGAIAFNCKKVGNSIAVPVFVDILVEFDKY